MVLARFVLWKWGWVFILALVWCLWVMGDFDLIVTVVLEFDFVCVLILLTCLYGEFCRLVGLICW